MKYTEFRDRIERELKRKRSGATWKELKHRLDLPYDRPCPTWVKQLEDEIGLTRSRNNGRAYVWKLD